MEIELMNRIAALQHKRCELANVEGHLLAYLQDPTEWEATSVVFRQEAKLIWFAVVEFVEKTNKEMRDLIRQWKQM